MSNTEKLTPSLEMRNTARTLAWRFHTKYGYEIDELLGEAHVAAAKAAVEYEEAREASLGTWTWQCVTNRLTDYVRAQKHRKQVEAVGGSPEIDALTSTTDVDRTEFFSMVAEMPSDARTVVRMILGSPEEYLALVRPLGGIVERVLRQEGWTVRRAKTAIQQIRKALA